MTALALIPPRGIPTNAECTRRSLYASRLLPDHENPGGALIPYNRAPTPRDRQAMRARFEMLESMLAPGDRARMIAHVTIMSGAFRDYGRGVGQAQTFARIWEIAIRRYPEWAVERAVELCIEGIPPNIDRVRGPTPPQFGELVRNIIAPYRAEHAQIGRILTARVDYPSGATLQQQAEIATRLNAFRAGNVDADANDRELKASAAALHKAPHARHAYESASSG